MFANLSTGMQCSQNSNRRANPAEGSRRRAQHPPQATQHTEHGTTNRDLPLEEQGSLKVQQGITSMACIYLE